jgi:hypothetical protein
MRVVKYYFNFILFIWIFGLIRKAASQDDFATVVKKAHVSSYFDKIQPVKVMGSNADWYYGDRYLFSIPDPNKRSTYWEVQDFCKLQCPNCIGVSSAIATFKNSEINAGMIHFLTKKTYENNTKNRHFWIGLKQEVFNGEEYIEPDEGYYWDSYEWEKYDYSKMFAWRDGQPDNFDEESNSRTNVHCGCFDAAIATGAADCSCYSQFMRIPICSITCKIISHQFCC